MDWIINVEEIELENYELAPVFKCGKRKFSDLEKMGEVAEPGQEVLNQAFDLDVAVGNGISPADIKRLKADLQVTTLTTLIHHQINYVQKN